MRYCFIIIAFLALSVVKAGAQGFTGSVQGNFIVYSTQSITVTALGGVISFDSPNDYFNGVIANKYANIKIKSNTNWLISFSAQSTYFTALSKGASTDMPSTVMGIRKNGHSTFKTLTTQSQRLESGSRGSKGDKHDFDIDVNFSPGFKYSGGLYSIGVVYTLTKQ